MKYLILTVAIIFLYLASVFFVLWGAPLSELAPEDRLLIIIIALFVICGANAGLAIISEDI